MENYEELKMEVITFGNEDIITASDLDPWEGEEG